MSHASCLVAIEPTEDVQAAVSYQMEPFDEGAEWFRDGSRWDWWVEGGRYAGRFCGSNRIALGQIKKDDLIAYRKRNLAQSYEEAEAEIARNGGEHVKMFCGFDPREIDRETYISRADTIWFPAFYAFLRNRHWNEGERLGWFGGTTATECERKNPEDVDIAVNRCLTKDEATGARIVVWNEPWELWEQHFYHRFIEPLPPETLLVVVDYHV
jgi:hypothetical protein